MAEEVKNDTPCTQVRAKFVVESIESQVGSVTGDGDGTGTVNLSAVYDSDPKSENGQFFRHTPSGTIRICTINPRALAFFEKCQKEKKAVYVDFSEADK